MKDINLSLLNIVSPYKVWKDSDGLHFITDNGIVYLAEFCEYDIELPAPAFWFNLYNLSAKASPNDDKLHKTIVLIIESFFEKNPDILLYMCDSGNNQQEMRSRLFMRWFKKYGSARYIIRTATIIDENESTYIAMIIQKDNPQSDAILKIFDEETNMFKENK